jgi:gas vesicle structural protein
MSIAATPRGYLERPRPSGLADVIDVILDKGLVIDAYVRVSLIGIEILTIDARIVIASVDTYLRFAEAVGRLDIAQDSQSEGLPQLVKDMTSGGAESKTKGAIEGVKDKLTGDDDGQGGHEGPVEKVKEKVTGKGRDDDDDDRKQKRQSQRSRSRSSSSSRSSSGSRSRSRKSG